MQLHTFIVDSALQAVERIRTELGPDAVVVSVRKLPPNGLSRLWKHEQVEVVASVGQPPAPPDPLQELRNEIRDLRAQVCTARHPASLSPATGSSSLLDTLDISPAAFPQGGRLSRLLVQTGLLPVYAEQVEQEVLSVCGEARPDQIAKEFDLARNYLKARWLARQSRSTPIHIFIGPAGSGKSTVLAKWLAQLVLVENEPVTVCQLDSHVANTSSIPELYSEILGARFQRSIPSEMDAKAPCLVDLPGFHPSDAKAVAALKQLTHALPEAQLHLVLNAAYESSTLLAEARKWAALGTESLILSHLDEESRWGKAWNLVIGTNFKVSHFSSGQNIPGDFRIATPEILFDRQFGSK